MCEKKKENNSKRVKLGKYIIKLYLLDLFILHVIMIREAFLDSA